MSDRLESIDLILRARVEKNPGLKEQLVVAEEIRNGPVGSSQNMIVTWGQHLFVVDDPREKQMVMKLLKMHEALTARAAGNAPSTSASQSTGQPSLAVPSGRGSAGSSE